MDLQNGALTARRVHFSARPRTAASTSLPSSSARSSKQRTARHSSRPHAHAHAAQDAPPTRHRDETQRRSAGSPPQSKGEQVSGASHGCADASVHGDPDLGNHMDPLRLDSATQIWQPHSDAGSMDEQPQPEQTPPHQHQEQHDKHLADQYQHQQRGESRDSRNTQREEASADSDVAACPLLISDVAGLERLRAAFERIDSLACGGVEKGRFKDVLVKAGVESALAAEAAHNFAAPQPNAQQVAWTAFLDQQRKALQQEQNEQPRGEPQPSNTHPSSSGPAQPRPHAHGKKAPYSVAQAMQALAAKYRHNPVTFRQLFARFDDDKDMELRQEQAVRFVQRALPDITAEDAEAAVDALPLTNTYPSGVAAVYFHHLHLVYRQLVRHILSLTCSKDDGRPSTCASRAKPQSTRPAPGAGHPIESLATSTSSTRPASRSSRRQSSSLVSTTSLAPSRPLSSAAARSSGVRSGLRRRQPTPGPQASRLVAVPALQAVDSGAQDDSEGDGERGSVSAATGLSETTEESMQGTSLQTHDATTRRALATQRLLELEAMPRATTIRSLKARKPPTIPLTNKHDLTKLSPEEQAAFMSNKPGAGLHLATAVREPVRVRESQRVMRELVAKHHDALLKECRKEDLHHTGLISSRELYRILTNVFDVELSRMAFEHVKHIADCRTDTSIPYTEFLATFASNDLEHSPAHTTMQESSAHRPFASAKRRPSHPHTGRRQSKPFHSQRFAVPRGQTPPVTDVHARLMPLLQPRWKAFLDACRRKDTRRRGVVSNRAFDDVLREFGVDVSDDEFSRLARRWAAPTPTRGVMYRKFVEKIALGGTGDTREVADSDAAKPSRRVRQLLKRLRPTVETRFSKIRRAMRAPGISHEQVPVSVFFRILDDHDIQLSKEEGEALLALYADSRCSLVSYTDFLTDVLTA